MGLLAEIIDILGNPKHEAERATPETVIALAVHKEGGKKDGSCGHEKRESDKIS